MLSKLLLSLALYTVYVSASYRPVVLMHGLGDSGSNPGIQSLAASISKTYPGIYAIAVNVANGLESYYKGMNEQVEMFASVVKSDPKLANGFNAAGLSQGGLIVRAYVERYNDPPVFNLISLCGPQQGVDGCPGGVPSWLCSMFESSPYNSGLVFSDYFKEVHNHKKYLEQNRFLPDINNENSVKNKTYRANILTLNKFVMVAATKDTMVQPYRSELFEFYPWMDQSQSKPTEVLPLNESDTYRYDWIGLQTLDQSKRLDFLTYPDDHLHFSAQFWETEILPYFDNKIKTSAIRIE